ncbi:hypothetical protein O6H91_06G004800 [Diphasiastrum complanatum]|uniref:Uncharacterized protein n=1 Tax=Diphasiastrum complanatum TaxID=34168 RepID=A0ACC2DAS8_DIPCM|nr:hypothetical protein O6H91_06G004800 [Diphasiastrum complanatum]
MDASQRASHDLSEAFSDVDCTLSLGTPATRSTQISSSSTQLSRLVSPVHDRDGVSSGVMPLWPYTNSGTKVNNQSNFATMEDLKRITSCKQQEQTVPAPNSAFCALAVPLETRSSNFVAVSGGAKSNTNISLCYHDKLKQANCHDHSARISSSFTSSLTEMIDISSYQESGDRISTYKPRIPVADSCQRFYSSLDLSCMSLSSCQQTFMKMNTNPGFAGPTRDFTDHCSALRTCAHCGTTKTPLWRNGPLGPKSLCNACGIRLKKVGRRVSSSTRGMQSWNMHTSASYSPIGSTLPPFNDQDYDRDIKSFGCTDSSAQDVLYSREAPSKMECDQILHAEKRRKVFQTMYSSGYTLIEVPATSRVNLESYDFPSILKSRINNPSKVTCVSDESSFHSENTNPVHYENNNHLVENSESDVAKAESTSTQAIPKEDEQEGAFLLMTLSSGVVKA